MFLHDMLIHLLTILDLVWAEGTMVPITSLGYEVFEQRARWLLVRVVLPEDMAQCFQRRGAISIQYIVRI